MLWLEGHSLLSRCPLSKKFPSFLLRWNGRTVVLSLKDGADRISSRVGGQVARVRGILYASFFLSGVMRVPSYLFENVIIIRSESDRRSVSYKYGYV